MIRFILAIHVLLCEIATLVLEIGTIHGKYFRENTCFDLLLELIYTIAVDECSPPGSMSM